MQHTAQNEIGCHFFTAHKHRGQFTAQYLRGNHDIGLNKPDTAEILGIIDSTNRAALSAKVTHSEDCECVLGVFFKHCQNCNGLVAARSLKGLRMSCIPDDDVITACRIARGRIPQNACHWLTARLQFPVRILRKGGISKNDDVIFPFHLTFFLVCDAIDASAEQWSGDRGQRRRKNGNAEHDQ